MHTSDLVNAVADAEQTSGAHAARMVAAVFAAIAQALCRGETVTIKDVGRFALKTTQPHTKRLPNGSAKFVPLHQTPIFRASSSLKRLVWKTIDERGRRASDEC